MIQPKVMRRTHFHIRWTGVNRLDWEPFKKRDQAESRAKELIQAGELFAIEEHDERCERCASKILAAS